MLSRRYVEIWCGHVSGGVCGSLASLTCTSILALLVLTLLLYVHLCCSVCLLLMCVCPAAVAGAVAIAAGTAGQAPAVWTRWLELLSNSSISNTWSAGFLTMSTAQGGAGCCPYRHRSFGIPHITVGRQLMYPVKCNASHVAGSRQCCGAGCLAAVVSVLWAHAAACCYAVVCRHCMPHGVSPLCTCIHTCCTCMCYVSSLAHNCLAGYSSDVVKVPQLRGDCSCVIMCSFIVRLDRRFKQCLRYVIVGCGVPAAAGCR